LILRIAEKLRSAEAEATGTVKANLNKQVDLEKRSAL
jgi:hypothetical protein